jgi:hypothetical protein
VGAGPAGRVGGLAVGDEHFGVGEVIVGVFALAGGGVGGVQDDRGLVPGREGELASPVPDGCGGVLDVGAGQCQDVAGGDAGLVV